ncbi:MAG: AraC family transcriptional regulator [bacterium]|nr:AraC family transcriptional regulator [bacterium]
MTDLIRSACLTHYSDVARSVGLDPREMLRQVRLPFRCLEQQDIRIAVASLRRLLEASTTAAGIEDFGLRLAQRDDLSTLGPVGLVVREQKTVGAAIEMLARYVHVHTEAVRLEIEFRDDLVMLVAHLRGRPHRATRQSMEMTVGMLHRIIRALLNENWRPREVHFMHAPPRSRRFHRQFFGCEVRFDSDFDAILCSADDMNRIIPTAHPAIASYVERRIELIAARPESPDEKVRELVRSLLPDGNCTIELVAQHLGCDRRTVHRRLSEQSTSFSAILDAERADIAMRLIEDGSRPLKEIAGLLGFSAQSALARWFRGKFHCSISEWRGDDRRRAVTALPRW